MALQSRQPSRPPLNALRAFEAAARQQSFSAAADELCVTPAAIAQQVRNLEAWLGAPLFERHARGVTLTAIGRAALPDFEAAFDALGAAVQALHTRARPEQVRIAALPGIAQYWLSPLLPEIRRQFPGLLVNIDALETAPNLNREAYDFSLYLEPENDSNDGVRLRRDILFPVCSPDYRERLERRGEADVITLLHDSDWAQDWPDWLQVSEEMEGFSTRDVAFSLYSLAIDEARHGAGLLMGHDMLVDPLLKTGELVAPFRFRLVRDQWLTLRVNGASLDNPNVSALSAWLTDRDQSSGSTPSR